MDADRNKKDINTPGEGYLRRDKGITKKPNCCSYATELLSFLFAQERDTVEPCLRYLEQLDGLVLGSILVGRNFANSRS